jgi:DNA-binding transcriptional regulator YiaG
MSEHTERKPNDRSTSVSAPRRKAKTPLRQRAKLSGREAIQVAYEAVISVQTVRRWARGERLHENTEVRLRQAIEKLGIEPAVAS